MPETTPAAIVADGLVKTYRGRGRRPDVRALDGLSFTVAPGIRPARRRSAGT
ncbi:hypothetical protein [uncultured Microbacterium sp.]|uniref:hypothetical protein n=1 Tax=uncultured Microbacterium sp. TaxID=191216 RepID=UPI0035C98BAA